MAKFLDSAGLTYLWGKIQQSINEQIAVNVKLEVVQALPASGEANIIYLVPGSTTATSNIYDEYIWAGNPGAWEKIGTTATDLSNYATTSDLNSAVQTINGSISDINTYIGSGYSSGSLTEAINDLFGIVGDGDSNWTLTEKIGDLIQAIGDPADTSSSSTVYGAIADLRGDVEGTIGTPSDASGDSTVYGAINSVKDQADALEIAVGDSNSGLVKDVNDLKTTVGDATSGLVKDVADNAANIATNISNISKLNTAVGNSSDAADATGSVYARIAQNAADIAAIGALSNSEIDSAIDAYVPSGN